MIPTPMDGCKQADDEGSAWVVELARYAARSE